MMVEALIAEFLNIELEDDQDDEVMPETSGGDEVSIDEKSPEF